MTEKISLKRKIKCGMLKAMIFLSSVLTALLLLCLIGYILKRGLPFVSIELLTSKPSFIEETVGILPNILNTVYVILITVCISLPLGVGAAIYLNEYAKNKKIVRVIELAAETLSGVPSVIYGLAGMLIFVNFCSLGTSLLSGSFTLVVMTLPTVIRTTQESLKTVPNGYREGALALGCGKWYMIRTVILPCVADAIVTGCILSIGKIVGESAALLFTAGMANDIMGIGDALKPNHPGSTLTVALYMYAKERGEFDIAFAIAAILLILTLAINLSAKYTAKFLKKKGTK